MEHVLTQEQETKRDPKPFKFKIGDHVCIGHLRNIFTREYDQKWSGEFFCIRKTFEGKNPNLQT